MNLITKTAQLIEETKQMIESATSAKNEAETKEEKNHYREMISEGRTLIKGIIHVKNELKEIHDSEECSCNHDINNPCGYGILIQEIESVENVRT